MCDEKIVLEITDEVSLALGALVDHAQNRHDPSRVFENLRKAGMPEDFMSRVENNYDEFLMWASSVIIEAMQETFEPSYLKDVSESAGYANLMNRIKNAGRA